jgi:hypothetical protein
LEKFEEFFLWWLDWMEIWMRAEREGINFKEK